jgi:hypothetical protein
MIHDFLVGGWVGCCRWFSFFLLHGRVLNSCFCLIRCSSCLVVSTLIRCSWQFIFFLSTLLSLSSGLRSLDEIDSLSHSFHISAGLQQAFRNNIILISQHGAREKGSCALVWSGEDVYDIILPRIIFVKELRGEFN